METRPLVVFIDGRVHLGKSQAARTKSYDHYYGKDGTESWNCTITTTETRKETNYTIKF